jgi:FkbM family methyltransferase
MSASVFLRLFSSKLRAVVRLLCWRILQPEIPLCSGTAIVRSDSDWEVANEVFVQREYDDAILQAFRTGQQERPLRILDLGANVGFFSIRCIDLYVQMKMQAPLELIAVEGSRQLFTDLERRLSGAVPKTVTLLLKNGLIGRRTGKAMFHSSWFNSCTNSISRDNKTSGNPLLNRYAIECEYIDLEHSIPADMALDLIKCDIEGSELEFLQSYPDLLRRTRSLIIELHPFQCDVEACRQMLQDFGFVKQRVVKNHSTHALEIYHSKELRLSRNSRNCD